MPSSTGKPTYPVRPQQQTNDRASRFRAQVAQRAKQGPPGSTPKRMAEGKKKWSAEEQRQREEAAAKSAAKRRKGGGGGTAAKPKLSDEAKLQLKRQEAKQAQVKKLYGAMVGMGLSTSDIVKKGDAVAGKTPEAHEKLLRAMRKLGMDFDVNPDGSAQMYNPVTEQVVKIAAPGGGKKWTRDGKVEEPKPVEEAAPEQSAPAPRRTVRVEVRRQEP